MSEAEIRDAFAVAAYPAALESAIKPYGHICDAVIETATRTAYWSADLAMIYRAKHIPEPTPTPNADGEK